MHSTDDGSRATQQMSFFNGLLEYGESIEAVGRARCMAKEEVGLLGISNGAAVVAAIRMVGACMGR